jgi:arginine exporter protein ArgO
MKPLTDKQKQWAWFAGLWFAGLIFVALLSYGIRWLIRL